MLTWLPWILQASQPWGGGGRSGWLLILLIKPPPSLAPSLPRPGGGCPLIWSLKLERPDFSPLWVQVVLSKVSWVLQDGLNYGLPLIGTAQYPDTAQYLLEGLWSPLIYYLEICFFRSEKR